MDLSRSPRCFWRKTLIAEGHEEVINTLAAIAERPGTESLCPTGQFIAQNVLHHLCRVGECTHTHRFLTSCIIPPSILGQIDFTPSKEILMQTALFCSGQRGTRLLTALQGVCRRKKGRRTVVILLKESWDCQLMLRKKKLKNINEPMKTISSQSHRNFWQEMSGGLMPVARLLAIVTTSKPWETSFSVAGRLKADLRLVARRFRWVLLSRN